jgi:hypothetical protein
MTTSVTINNGPLRVNVNQVEPGGPLASGKEKTVATQTLAKGAETTLNLWGHHHYLNVIETNDMDTPNENLPDDHPDNQPRIKKEDTVTNSRTLLRRLIERSEPGPIHVIFSD